LAAAATWESITGKPSTFTPSTHTHPYTDITSAPWGVGTVTSVSGAGYTTNSGTATDPVIVLTAAGSNLLAGALQGARYTGNEINIISGGLYLTREFYERVFAELPGVTDAEPPALGIPRATELAGKTYATINAKLRFKLDGKQVDLDFSGERAIVVTWNKGMGVDAVHGKARKRIYAHAFRYVSGRSFDETGDADVIEGQILDTPPQDAPVESESTVTAENDQSIDLETEAAEQLKGCKTVEQVDQCVRRWLEEDGVDIRELGELKKQALQTVGSRGARKK
jgi:hypothetical protein